MDAVEVLCVACHDLQQVVGAAGYQVTYQHIRHLGHRRFKGIQDLIGYCQVNSPSLQVVLPFVDQPACATDFHAPNASSR